MDVGKRIKELRSSKNMTQAQLSRDLHIGVSTLSGYEVGRRDPNLEMLCRFADYFNVSVDFLLGRTGGEHFPEF